MFIKGRFLKLKDDAVPMNGEEFLVASNVDQVESEEVQAASVAASEEAEEEPVEDAVEEAAIEVEDSNEEEAAFEAGNVEEEQSNDDDGADDQDNRSDPDFVMCVSKLDLDENRSRQTKRELEIMCQDPVYYLGLQKQFMFIFGKCS